MFRLRAHEISRRAAAFFFPNRCPFCGELCGISELWHERCYMGLSFLEKMPEPPEGLSALYAVCAYEGMARNAVLSYKEGSFIYSAEAFAALISELLGERAGGAEVLVPVPSGGESVIERGYSPAREIARLISIRSGIPVSDALCAPFKRGQQKQLSAAKRQENAEKSFSLKTPRAVSGKRVLLIDDVCTTGSTLSVCADLLKKAGAAEVFGAVFAKTRYIGE